MAIHKIILIFTLLLELFSSQKSFAQTSAYFSELIREEMIVAQAARAENDWLTIMKVAKALVNQKENALALQITPWAELIIGNHKIINGARYLATFYKNIEMSKESREWEISAQNWNDEFKQKWKNK